MSAIPLAPAVARRRRRQIRPSRVAYVFIAPFLLAFVTMLVVPIGYALYLSLFRSRLVGGSTFVGLANYVQVLADPQFFAGLGRVALYLVVQMPVMIVLATFLALALDTAKVRGGAWARLAIFAPYAIPGVVTTLLWGYFYGRSFGVIAQLFGWLGLTPPDLLSEQNILGSMMNITTWAFVGYNMVVVYSALQTIAPELFEAAAMDGAGPWRIAWSIKLPAVRPAITLCVIFSVIGSLQLFTEPAVLQPLAPTVVDSAYTPAFYSYNLAFVGQQGNYAAAVAFVLGFAIMVVSYVVQLSQRRKAER